jgi:hypothetical protein
MRVMRVMRVIRVIRIICAHPAIQRYFIVLLLYKLLKHVYTGGIKVIISIVVVIIIIESR